MANTATALCAQLFGPSLAAALPQVGGIASNLDILQLVDDNGDQVLVNVDYAGVVHNPAVSPTLANGVGNTRLGSYITTAAPGSTTAQFFAAAFSNPSLLDVIQVCNIGGNISYYRDYLGVAHGS